MIERMILWLLLAASVLLGACASAPTTRSPGLDADAAWVLLVPGGERPDALHARSVQVLAETRLRALGIERLTLEPGDSALGPVASRARAAAGDGHRYAVALSIETWWAGARPGDAPRVALALEVHDLVGDTLVVHERAEERGHAGAGLTATAERVLARLLDALPVVRDGTATDALPPANDADAMRAEAVGVAEAADALVRGIDVPPAARARGAVAAAPLTALRAAAPSPRAAAADDDAVVDAVALDTATVAALEGRATAFFYGADLPLAALAQFDRVVLEPDNVRASDIARLRARGAAAFAYLSVGEVGPTRAWHARLDPRWVLGRNEAWGSAVMDLAGGGWMGFLDRRVDALVEAGYAGLFLDTMDSYLLHVRTPMARAAQARALGGFVRRTRARYPELRLIANRGFEVLDVIGPSLEAIAAESLYARWDNATARYSAVPAADRAWLLDRLEEARARHALDVIAIDYVPPERRDEARAVAARIAAHGFVPWVGTPALDHVGVGAIDVLPREVLMLFDSRLAGSLAAAEVHRLLAAPLEYLGYVPHYHDLATRGVPDANLGGRFAGVVHWSRGGDVTQEMQDWFESVVSGGVPIALFGSSWLTAGSSLATRLGVTVDTALDADSVRARTADALIGFERPLPPRIDSVGASVRSTVATNTVHLGVVDRHERTADLVITGPWGGLAAQPGVIETDLDGVVYWVVDPYTFLRRALHLPRAPMPDVTSEDGRRLWLAHIDGDALPSWAELPGRPRLGAELIRERILERYPLPHTISVVEAEMTQFPAHADRRARMFSVMRGIFAMPNVEIASHTFSHPFDWAGVAADDEPGRHNLPIPGYRYSPEREVGGSAAFIDAALAPPGKRTRVMLWSGLALPNAADLAAAARAGLANVNGGFTTITRARPAASLVAPMARPVGEHVQVYAPIMNENVYTNDWRGPFDGYRRVIETFELTERPRRLKPLGIYYHFYAGTKEASLTSLEEVYAWSLAQPVHPLTLSDYAARVNVFREAGVARRLDGSWRLHGLGTLRSVRVLGTGAERLGASGAGVQRVHALHDGLYLHTDGGDTVHIRLAPAARPRAASPLAEWYP